MDGSAHMVGQLFLRTPDGTIYGPVDMVTLCGWATDARVIPGCELSSDNTHWKAAHTFPELRLNWRIQLADGSFYGPLNLLAVWALLQEDSVQRGLTIVERDHQRTLALDDSLLPEVVDESRRMLAEGGKLAAGFLSVLKVSQQETTLLLKTQDEQKALLQKKLEATERDLAASIKLVNETQRYLSKLEETSRLGETKDADAEILRAELVAVQQRSGESEKMLHAAEQSLRESQSAHEAATHQLEELRRQLSAGEARQSELLARLTAMERDASRLESTLQEALAREERIKKQYAGELEALKSETAQQQNELKRERAANVALEKGKEEAVAGLRDELAQWDVKFQAVLVEVRKMEALLHAREGEFTSFRHEAERKEAELMARVASFKKEADAARRRVQETEALHEQTQREALQSREYSEALERTLREELASVHRDLNGILMAGASVRQVGESPPPAKRSSINWMDQHHSPGGTSASGHVTVEQLEKLHRELSVSSEEKETLRRMLDNLRAGHEEFKRNAREQLAQQQQQIKAATGMVHQALEELEQREAQIRLARKKAEEREKELLARIDKITTPERESVIVEPEVIAPGAWSRTERRVDEGAPSQASGRPGGLDLLHTVELQLRAELKKWDHISRDRGRANGKSKKWFERKST